MIASVFAHTANTMGAEFTLLLVQSQLNDARSRINELETNQEKLQAIIREQQRIIGELTRELGNAIRPQEAKTAV